MFISIVIGIGIDYGIYFLFRYEEELFLGRNLREALEITAARSGPGVLLERGHRRRHLLRAVPDRLPRRPGARVHLRHRHPALVARDDDRVPGRAGAASTAATPTGRAARCPRAIALERMHVPLVERIAGHPRTVLAVAAVLTAGLAAGAAARCEFDYNLLNLQAERHRVGRRGRRRILATSGRSGFAALASADSLDELRRKQHGVPRAADRLRGRLRAAAHPRPAAREAQGHRATSRRSWRRCGSAAPIAGRPGPAGGRAGDAPAPLRASPPTRRRRATPSATLSRVAQDIGRLVIKLRQTDPRQRRRRPDPAAAAGLPRLRHQLPAAAEQPQSAHDRARRRAAGDQARSSSATAGRFLLQIHPAVNIWDRDGAARFVAELRVGGPRGDGHADHHLRGDPADGARLQAGHALRDRPRLRRSPS